MPLPHSITLHGGPKDGVVEEVNDPWPRTQLVVSDGEGGTLTYYVRDEEPEEADYEPNPTEDGLGTEPPFGAVGPEGPQGPEGPEGPQGPEGPRGEGFNFVGTYKAENTYAKGDCVFKGNIAYVSIVNGNTGHDPETDEGAHWSQAFMGLNPRGTYNPELTYNAFDFVEQEGSSYLCVAKANPHVEPFKDFAEEGGHWQLVAKAGTPGGEKGVEGEPGPEGKEGKEGAEGALGPEGPEGKEGASGVDGNTIIYGSGPPTLEIGHIGDTYIDKVEHFIYGPKSESGWPEGVALATGERGPEGKEGKEGPEGKEGKEGKAGPEGAAGVEGPEGPEGKPGNTILFGKGVPSNELGRNGDAYIDEETHFFYGPKAAGVWPEGVALASGPAGPEGKEGKAGKGGGGGGGETFIHDSFTENLLGTYVFDQSTSAEGLKVEGGFLSSGDSNDHSFHTSIEVEDAVHVMEFERKGATPTTYLMLKYIDDKNFVIAQLNNNQLHVYQQLEGAYTLVTESASFEPPTGKRLWMVGRMSGNEVSIEIWETNPSMLGVAGMLTSVRGELTGGGALAFGKGIKAPTGLRLTGEANPGPTETKIFDWFVGSSLPVLGSGGGGGSDATFEFKQEEEAETWTIKHDLEKHPCVQIFDTEGDETLADIKHLSINELTVTFTPPMAGVAYLN